MKQPGNLAERLEKRYGDKTIGELELEYGITKYNHTGLGFGYIVDGELPKDIDQAMKDISLFKVE